MITITEFDLRRAVEDPLELERFALQLEKDKNSDDLMEVIFYIAKYWEDIKDDDRAEFMAVKFIDDAVEIVAEQQGFAEEIEEDTIPTHQLVRILESIGIKLAVSQEELLDW